MVKFKDLSNMEYPIIKSHYEKEGWDLEELKAQKPWLPIFSEELYDDSRGVCLDVKDKTHEFKDIFDLPLHYQKMYQNTFYTKKEAIEYIIEHKLDDNLYQQVECKVYQYDEKFHKVKIKNAHRKIWCVEYDYNSSVELFNITEEYLGCIPFKQEYKDGIWHIYDDFKAKQ